MLPARQDKRSQNITIFPELLDGFNMLELTLLTSLILVEERCGFGITLGERRQELVRPALKDLHKLHAAFNLMTGVATNHGGKLIQEGG